MLPVVERLGLHRLEPQAVDPEARVDPADLQEKERADAVGVRRRPGEPHLDPLHRLIGAVAFEPHAPRPPSGGPQPVAEGGKEPVERRDDVGLEPDRVGEGEPDGEVRRGLRGRDGFGLHPHRLVEPLDEVPPEAPGEARAGLAGEVRDPPDAEPGEIRRRLGRKPECCDRQGAERRPGLPGQRDPRGPRARRLPARRGTALLPAAPLHRAGAGGPGLLVDRVRGAGDGHGLARIPGERPGRAQRVGDAAMHRQAEVRALRRDPVEERLLPSEEMGAAREVDDEGRGRLLGHPGRELARPAAQRRQERRLGQRIRGAREKRGAHRLRVAQGLAAGQPLRLGLGRERGEHLRVPALGHDGEGALAPPALDAERAFGREAREPEGEDPAVGHRPWQRQMFTICSNLAAAWGRVESGSAGPVFRVAPDRAQPQ